MLWHYDVFNSAAFQQLIYLFPSFIVLSIVLAYLLGWLKTSVGMQTVKTRKIYHLAIFTLAWAIQVRWGFLAVMAFGAAVFSTVAFAIISGKAPAFYQALARESDAAHSKAYVVGPLLATAIGGLISNLFFLKFAPIGYLVTGWGDAAGETIGKKWGKHHYTVSLSKMPTQRSLEGSLGVLVVSFLAAAVGLYFLDLQISAIVSYSLVIGVLAMLTEAVSSHGMDNLTMQVVTAAALQIMVGLN